MIKILRTKDLDNNFSVSLPDSFCSFPSTTTPYQKKMGLKQNTLAFQKVNNDLPETIFTQ